MNLFDMSRDLARFEQEPQAVLLDVREPEEYASGHIPGSINVPLDGLERYAEENLEQITPIFLYCLSGARSFYGALQLKRRGWKDVTDLGGIYKYHGKVVK